MNAHLFSENYLSLLYIENGSQERTGAGKIFGENLEGRDLDRRDIG